jgi:hypothetical protein
VVQLRRSRRFVPGLRRHLVAHPTGKRMTRTRLMQASIRWFGWITVVMVLHMAEQGAISPCPDRT